jgi:tetratricopeptide (TPR) repeat protein
MTWDAGEVQALSALVQAGRYNEALRVFDARGGEHAAAPPEAEYVAAMAAARLGSYGRAARLGESAWKRLSASADEVGAMKAANLLGGVALEQGRLDDAEARFEETIRRAHSLDDLRMAARASNNLGSLAHLKGKSALALSLYRSSLQVYRASGDMAGAAQTCHNLALVLRGDGQVREALEASCQAVAAAEGGEDTALLAIALAGRAEIWLELGEADQAEQDLQRAWPLAQDAGDELGLAELERLEAVSALRHRRFGRAVRHARRGQAIASRLGSAQLTGECAAVCALASRALGCERLAEGFRKTAIAAFRSLGAVGPLHRFEQEWAA